MEQKYAKLYEQSKIGNMMLKNRFVLAPCSTGTSHLIDDRLIDYYVTRAKGGFGMVILEAQPISSVIAGVPKTNTIGGTPAQWKTWYEFNNRVKTCGVKTCIQLAAGGGCMSSALDDTMVSASDIPAFFNPNVKCRACGLTKI